MCESRTPTDPRSNRIYNPDFPTVTKTRKSVQSKVERNFQYMRTLASVGLGTDRVFQNDLLVKESEPSHGMSIRGKMKQPNQGQLAVRLIIRAARDGTVITSCCVRVFTPHLKIV